MQRDFRNFPTTTNPGANATFPIVLGNPSNIQLYQDSFLIVENNLHRNPFHARVVRAEDGQEVVDVFPVSRKLGGALSFSKIGLTTEGDAWVFDIAKNGFIFAPMSTLLQDAKGPESYHEIRIPRTMYYYEAALLDSDWALLSGNYNTDEKLTLYHLLDTTKNHTLLTYSQDSTIGKSRYNKMRYQSYLFVKPDRSRVVLAARYADQIEIFDLETEYYRKVIGPEGMAPALDEYHNRNRGVVEATPGSQTHFGYLGGFVTDRYIYLLYSGHYWRSSRKFSSSQIHVFDWEGAPVKRIDVDDDIIDLAVSTDDRVLYTLNQTKRQIKRYRINN